MDALIRRALRDWRYPAAVAVALFALAFALASLGARIGLDNARREVAQFQAQATCRADLAATVEAARSNVAAVDGQLIATMAIAFTDALAPPLTDERRAQLRQLFRDQLDAREALQTVLDEELHRQAQADVLCPG